MMSIKATQKLVEDTLQAAFNEEDFISLVKNILNSFDEKAIAIYQGNRVFADFKDSIHSLKRVGKYKSPDNKIIDILIVRLAKNTSLDRARTMQRNYVAKYLKGSRGGELKDAALVAFVAPNGKDWRFSFVKIEYKFGKEGKVKEEFTPARRYSFLVGENEKSHTAQSRLLPVLDDKVSPTLGELEGAFSVEPVTKEFFDKYRELFWRLKESLDIVIKENASVRADFRTKNIDTVDFAKKLLGQIVFLYFLQKKGWFGVQRGKKWGTGSRHFLRELFNKQHGDYENFFNDVLEPLFYEALSREHSGDYYKLFNCRIPFLNGGLFDPIGDYNWWGTDILLPDDIFSNKNRTKEGNTGDGILDVFDRYNFTVKEDEPLEKEVAVDPEMLGKVFENLLEVTDRKSKGTYYTPREIVHYMCQESLANYLVAEFEGLVSKEEMETLIKYGEDVAENDRHVMHKGCETERYRFKLPQNVYKHVKCIDEKLASIRVCDPAVGSGAFPVGMMHEIVRVRNTLTAYIGEDSERTPYHFKRQAIQHCLYGVDIDSGAVEIAKLRLWLSLVVEEEERETVQPLPNLDYKIVQGNSLLNVKKSVFNNILFNELEELKPLYFNETSTNKKQKYREQIEKLINQITHGHKKFDFEVYFSEVFHEEKGFDVVIANPPYINVSDMKDKASLYRTLFSTPFGNYDIYILFFEKSIKILKQKGILTYITSNKYIIADYAKKLRKFMLDNTKLLTLLDLADCKQVFEHAIVSPAITIMQKKKINDYQVQLGLLRDEDIYNLGNIPLVSTEMSNLVEEMNFIFNIYSVGESKNILKKLNINTVPLYKIADVRTGVMGFEYWKMEPFIEDGNKSGYIRIITNGQIGKYTFLFDQKINLYKKCLVNPYLDVQHAPVNETTRNLFLAKKIIIRGVAKRLTAQLDDTGYAVLVAVHTAIPKIESDYLYLLGLLNSTLFNWYHLSKFYTARIPMGSLKYPISFLKSLPIKVDGLEKKQISTVTRKILAITQDNTYLEKPAKQAKVREYEQQIDQLVYKLYGLTAKEIKIIENFIKSNKIVK